MQTGSVDDKIKISGLCPGPEAPGKAVTGDSSRQGATHSGERIGESSVGSPPRPPVSHPAAARRPPRLAIPLSNPISRDMTAKQGEVDVVLALMSGSELSSRDERLSEAKGEAN